MLRKVAFHPFLFAIYPAIALFAFNMGQARLSDILRALAMLLGCAGLMLFLLRLLLQDTGRAALLTSLSFLLFFSFGHLVDRLASTRFGPFFDRLPWILPLAYAVVLAAGIYLAGFRWKTVDALTPALNVMGLVLLILPLYAIITFNFRNRAPVTTDFIPPADEASQTIRKPSNLPDIYYIIADGYARADVLANLYQLDNAEFLGFLESRGFVVASASHANYDQTALSVSSSLNFDYLDGYARELGIDSQNREVLYKAIDHSRLRAILEQAGYTFVDVNSGNPITQIKDADYYLTPSRSLVINYFERELLAGSVVGGLVQTDLTEQYRARMLNQFELGGSLGWIQSPKFVFIHIVAPHPPFVFDASGNPVEPPELIMSDGSRYPGSRADYLEGYRQQLLFINGQLEGMLNAILAQPGLDPVIILQGDHGPGAYLDWTSADNSCIIERTAILNAYRIPGLDPAEVYPGITPVNTFRLVLNAVLGTSYGLLPDRTYMPSWDMPYDFIDVTARDDSCTVLP